MAKKKGTTIVKRTSSKSRTARTLEPKKIGGTVEEFLDAAEKIERDYRPTGIIISLHK